MKSFLKALVPTLSLLLGVAAHAGEGQQRLERFLDGMNTMRAEFVQTLVEPDGSVLEESRGELLVSRPGRFRLEYLKPYRQTYVADGERIWMYDRDLEQVTVRKQEEALGNTPAQLLSDTRPVTDDFRLDELGQHEGFTWLELTPKARDATFAYLRLALEENVLRAMEMVDGMGQTTRLWFETVERNPRIEPAAFVFKAPAGVDVIGDRQ